MTEHRARDGGASRPAIPPPQRASGTVRRSDLRPRPRRQSPVGWPLFTAGLVIGAIAVAWMLGRPSSQSVGGATSSPLIVAAASPSPNPVPTRSSATSVSPTAVPTPRLTPRPTLEPTPPPSLPIAFSIVFPTDGEVLHDRQFNVVGTGPAGATVTRDVPLWFDDHVTVQADGTWLMPVSLGEGSNTFRFRIGNERATERAISVTYAPGG